MKRTEILRRLEERLARGEISEKTYIEIKARYEAEPEEAEVPPSTPSVEGTVAQATQAAARATEEAVRAAGEALRAVDFSGLGVRLSDEMIKIAGAGVVSGQPVRTREFKAAGSARVRGDLEAESTKVAGSCAFEGSVRTDEFRASGSVRVEGALSADNLEASGSLEVGKDLTADKVVTSGSLRIGGAAKADSFQASGSVRIQGPLVADSVDIELAGSSTVQSIEADSVRVRASGGFLRSRGDLTVGRIQADDVYLEGTTADLVVADRVRLGPHCRVKVVEAESLVVHESSEVAERRTPAS